MSKFLPAINVYEGDILSRLIEGTLTFQPGQWIRCGQGPCSRWCGVTVTGSLVAAHPRGKEGVTNDRFRTLLDYHRTRS
jgi:hypothetical protein